MKHCFKCNSFKRLVGGALVLAGNGRQRFVCSCCLPKASNRIVLLYRARPRMETAVACAQ